MNTIRELKQQEKYKSMLKRKNKEKKIYKDKNASLQLEKQRLYIALRNKDKEIERLNNIINELEKSKEKQINEYEILILKIERYLNCYQYFLETQEENNKKIANMIHEFSLGSNKE